jgi:hypothetical protein
MLVVLRIIQIILLCIKFFGITLIKLDHWSYQIVGTRDLEKVKTIWPDGANFMSAGLFDQVFRQSG